MIHILGTGCEGRWEKGRGQVEKIRMFVGTLLLRIIDRENSNEFSRIKLPRTSERIMSGI
jgi:hypothetical protein